MTGLEPLVIAQIAGTAVSVLGTLQAGRAEQSAANFNASVQQRNALIARQNAQAQASREERLARIRMGANRASAGAGGGGVAGSALDLIEDNALEDALTRRTILQQGDLQAQGLETNAQMDRLRGKTAKKQSFVRAGSQLLLGGAKTYNTLNNS